MRHRGPAVSHRVVNIVQRHHPVVIVGSGSRALCSYTCVQILIGHHDAWSALGRQTGARPRVHAAREAPMHVLHVHALLATKAHYLSLM